jgi:peptidoglycan/xylan/chitin deacetylase (PgdA/CDA1 family)
VFVIVALLLDIAYFSGSLPWGWLLVVVLVYVHLLVLGAIYIRWNFYLFSFSKGKNKQQIALTFDDGPAGETAAILDILKEQKVPAAFFSIGKNAAAHPELVKRWDAEGHLVGNHSYNHGFNFDWQCAKKMLQEIDDTNRFIQQTIGKKPRLFRPPYGVTNPNLARAVKMAGMDSIGWNIRSFDTKAKDPQQLLDRIVQKLRGGDIILLHDSMGITKEILTELIAQARKKGFTFVRVDQLLDIEAYA